MDEKNKKNNAGLERAIIKTIAFFDLFDYPLTEFEIWKWLWGGNANIKELSSEYSELSSFIKIENNILEIKNGFYFLPGREEIIKTRMERYNFTDRKLKRALRVAKLFKIIPWVKMIAVGNLMGAHNLKDEGDIDLFIITDKGKVWLVRFFCVVFMKFLSLRPQIGDMRDKICLSFFVSEEAMNLEEFMKKIWEPNSQLGVKLPKHDDIYFIYWLAGLAPIYNRDNVYEKFIEANGWMNNFLPNWRPVKTSWRRNAGKGLPKIYRVTVNALLGWSELIFKKIQLQLMSENLKEAANKNTNVVIGDEIIKLHSSDRREEYGEKWRERLKFLISNF